MRKLIYAINLSIDGCCDHSKMAPPEGLYDYHTNLLRDTDVLVFGRITYQLMVPYWPDIAKDHSGDAEENAFAQAFDSVGKIVVFSKTLDKAEGKNTSIIRANLKDEILKLKQEEGKNILVGGVDIPSQLTGLGLIDEYRFIVQPTLVGEGRRLFEDISLAERLSLKLVESRVFASGTIVLRYLKG